MAENFKTIADNRKARHDYFVLEALETGIELVGTEVKSIRTGSVNLKDSWVDIVDGELDGAGNAYQSLMRREISSTGIRCARAACWRTKRRSAASRHRSSRTV